MRTAPSAAAWWRARSPERASHDRRIEPGEAFLAIIGKVWIGRHGGTRGVEMPHLLRTQRPADGTEVVYELPFIACADDDRRNGRALQQPVDGDLRHALAGLRRNRLQRIENRKETRVIDRWTVVGGLVQAAAFR